MDEQSNEQVLPGDHFRFSPIEEYFLIDIGSFWLLFLSIVVFAIITYKLGFAKSLPLLKSLVVYLLLILGCFILIPFAYFGLPIIEVLIVTSIVLAIYRYRLHKERQSET
ncbi:YlaH-like family protein [Aquisalibacillus elongatus]|uniref:YlaH-like protein n=1 Tax=Aquisalibacillus elongatus TaxID=485577 RepID=A0A3N5C970_9BACI|nr:YlaH-like family protein [Aquisalibacillus elongatus]RPF56132.1 YlaH-like protein [Aquisalibacillus elongatus]